MCSATTQSSGVPMKNSIRNSGLKRKSICISRRCKKAAQQDAEESLDAEESSDEEKRAKWKKAVEVKKEAKLKRELEKKKWNKERELVITRGIEEDDIGTAKSGISESGISESRIAIEESRSQN